MTDTSPQRVARVDTWRLDASAVQPGHPGVLRPGRPGGLWPGRPGVLLPGPAGAVTVPRMTALLPLHAGCAAAAAAVLWCIDGRAFLAFLPAPRWGTSHSHCPPPLHPATRAVLLALGLLCWLCWTWLRLVMVLTPSVPAVLQMRPSVQRLQRPPEIHHTHAGTPFSPCKAAAMLHMGCVRAGGHFRNAHSYNEVSDALRVPPRQTWSTPTQPLVACTSQARSPRSSGHGSRPNPRPRPRRSSLAQPRRRAAAGLRGTAHPPRHPETLPT